MVHSVRWFTWLKMVILHGFVAFTRKDLATKECQEDICYMFVFSSCFSHQDCRCLRDLAGKIMAFGHKSTPVALISRMGTSAGDFACGTKQWTESNFVTSVRISNNRKLEWNGFVFHFLFEISHLCGWILRRIMEFSHPWDDGLGTQWDNDTPEDHMPPKKHVEC